MVWGSHNLRTPPYVVIVIISYNIDTTILLVTNYNDSNDHYSKGNCCRRKMPGPNFHGTDLGFGWVVLVCYFMSAQCEGNGWASEILHGVKTKNTGVSVEGWAGIGNLISGCLYWPF